MSGFPASSAVLLLNKTVSSSPGISLEGFDTLFCWSGCDDEAAGGEASEDRGLVSAEKLGSDVILLGMRNAKCSVIVQREQEMRILRPRGE